MISISRWKPIIKNPIGAPTGSATNDTSDYGFANKHGTCNDERGKLGIGQGRKGKISFNHFLKIGIVIDIDIVIDIVIQCVRTIFLKSQTL